MNFQILLIVLAVLIAVCIILFCSVVTINLVQAHNEKKKKADLKKIRPVLKRLFAAEADDFQESHARTLSRLESVLKYRSSQKTLEDQLLETLEEAGSETRLRARAVADYFGFPQKSLSMISERLTANIAIGCRKAGLYRYEEAVPGILKTLDILSSATQYEALMALSRIGNIDAMEQALDKISGLVFVNERAVNEILCTFAGDKNELFRRMVHHESEYIVRLFLKASDRETANLLIKDITAIMKSGSKETRLACIVAIGKSGNTKKIPMLIKAMNDSEWEIRAMAAKTLGVLTGPSAVPALVKAARDSEWWVRQNAVTSILAYPDCYGILASIVRTGDRYAYDSILFTIEKSNNTMLLSGIRELWLERSALSARPKSVMQKPIRKRTRNPVASAVMA